MDDLERGGSAARAIQAPRIRFGHPPNETVVQLSKGERSSTPLRVELDGSDVDFASLREDATYPQIKDYVLERFGLKVTSLQIAQTKRKYGLQVGTNHNVSKKVKPVVPQCPLKKETAIREALLHFQMI